MTTANNFPDLNISPIRRNSGESELNSGSSISDNIINLSEVQYITLPVPINDSILKIQKSFDNDVRALQHNMQSFSICERGDNASINNVSHITEPSNSSVVIESFDSESKIIPNLIKKHTSTNLIQKNVSSDEAFNRLESAIAPLLNQSDSILDCGLPFTGDDCFDFLGGTKVFVDMKADDHTVCIKNKLRKMGAFVSKRFTPTTTHVIFSREGSKRTLKAVLNLPNRPHLLDAHWVHDCWDQKTFVPELSYSLYDGHFLLESLRRVSSSLSCRKGELFRLENSDLVELTPEDYGISNKEFRTGSRAETTISSVELTFDKPMTATQLLAKIDKLSKKLDDLTSCPNKGNPISRENSSCCLEFASVGVNTSFNSNVENRILRRRTHAAFPLEYRAPFSSAVASHQATKEAAAAEIGQSSKGPYKIISSALLPAQKKQVPVLLNCVNDMRKTTETNLNRIRQTLQHNASYQKQKGSKSIRLVGQPTKINIHNRKTEMSNGTELSLEPPKGRKVIKTVSKEMNNWQCIPSSDEFIDKKESRIKYKEKQGIVFTSFRKRDESILQEHARFLKLRIQTEITQNTRCVVSATGRRTLATLKAIVNGIPVVTPDWLKDSLEVNILLPFDGYVYEEWQEVIEKRLDNSNIFDAIGKIAINDGCSPPARDLRYITRKSGGEIAESILDANMVVTSPTSEFNIPWSDNPPIIVGEKYILDCITQNILLPFEEYITHRIELIPDSD